MNVKNNPYGRLISAAAEEVLGTATPEDEERLAELATVARNAALHGDPKLVLGYLAYVMCAMADEFKGAVPEMFAAGTRGKMCMMLPGDSDEDVEAVVEAAGKALAIRTLLRKIGADPDSLQPEDAEEMLRHYFNHGGAGGTGGTAH
jgi:hypothetical protein